MDTPRAEERLIACALDLTHREASHSIPALQMLGASQRQIRCLAYIEYSSIARIDHRINNETHN